MEAKSVTDVVIELLNETTLPEEHPVTVIVQLEPEPDRVGALQDVPPEIVNMAEVRFCIDSLNKAVKTTVELLTLVPALEVSESRVGAVRSIAI